MNDAIHPDTSVDPAPLNLRERIDAAYTAFMAARDAMNEMKPEFLKLYAIYKNGGSAHANLPGYIDHIAYSSTSQYELCYSDGSGAEYLFLPTAILEAEDPEACAYRMHVEKREREDRIRLERDRADLEARARRLGMKVIPDEP